MGWCGGTDIFDKVMSHVLNNQNYTNDMACEIGSVLMDALDDQDWDTHEESMFCDHPALIELFDTGEVDTEDD